MPIRKGDSDEENGESDEEKDVCEPGKGMNNDDENNSDSEDMRQHQRMYLYTTPNPHTPHTQQTKIEIL